MCCAFFVCSLWTNTVKNVGNMCACITHVLPLLRIQLLPSYRPRGPAFSVSKSDSHYSPGNTTLRWWLPETSPSTLPHRHPIVWNLLPGSIGGTRSNVSSRSVCVWRLRTLRLTPPPPGMPWWRRVLPPRFYSHYLTMMNFDWNESKKPS